MYGRSLLHDRINHRTPYGYARCLHICHYDADQTRQVNLLDDRSTASWMAPRIIGLHIETLYRWPKDGPEMASKNSKMASKWQRRCSYTSFHRRVGLES